MAQEDLTVPAVALVEERAFLQFDEKTSANPAWMHRWAAVDRRALPPKAALNAAVLLAGQAALTWEPAKVEADPESYAANRFAAIPLALPFLDLEHKPVANVIRLGSVRSER